MGDLGGPLLSTIEQLPIRSKSGALHVENCSSPANTIHSISLDRSANSISLHMASDKDEEPLHAVDTPMQNTGVNTPAEPTTPTSDQASNALLDQPKTVDFAAKASEGPRPTTAGSSASSFKPPTPVHTYKEHPRLWIDDGPKAGKAIADWRREYVPIFEEQTRDMTMEERTQFFDNLVRQDQDRYCQALATYYTVHPEHLPERELDPKTARKFEAGMESSPKIDMAQQRCFGAWMDKDDKWGPRTTEPAPELGPKNEASPVGEAPECEHCVKEAKKDKSVIRRTIRKLSMSKNRQSDKQRSRRATESCRDQPCNVVISIPEGNPDEEEEEEAAEPTKDNDYVSSSSDGKEREARTETGVGLAQAMPKKKASVVHKLRLSTVHTR